MHATVFGNKLQIVHEIVRVDGLGHSKIARSVFSSDHKIFFLSFFFQDSLLSVSVAFLMLSALDSAPDEEVVDFDLEQGGGRFRQIITIFNDFRK
jgi:hypothetical protein